jgi:predicted NBD/HSP70 family sugar kinase
MLLRADTDDSGAIGAGRVLRLIRDGQAETRTELARLTRLSRSTLADRVQSLLALRLVQEIGGHESTGGRPPSTLTFNRTAGVVLAADVGPQRTRVAVTDLAAEPLAETVFSIDATGPPELVLGAVRDQFETLLATIALPGVQVWGVGVAVPALEPFGPAGSLIAPMLPGAGDFSIPAWFATYYDVPVLVDDHVNATALGEHSAHWRDVEHLVFVEISEGIACGIVMDARVHRGVHGAAGAIGHIRVAGHDDVACRCGNSGCLEALAGGRALAARLTAAGVPASSGGDVVALVRAGEPTAVQAVRDAGRLIGEVLAEAINFFNPGAIVIGGELAGVHQPLLAGVREVAVGRSLPMATRDLRLGASALGDRAGLIGAGVMVIEHVLAPETVDRAVQTHSR